MSLRQEFRGTNAVFPAACFCFCFRAVPFLRIPAPPLPFPSPSSPWIPPPGVSRAPAQGEDFSAWERSRCGRHAHWGRRTAHAGRWRAWRPENRGSPGSPPACVIAPGAIGRWRVRLRPDLAKCASELTASPALGSGNQRVGSGVPPAREKAGALAGCEGAGPPAGQHESAAAGAETAQPACGPSRGDGTPPVPRPHQRGRPAGKSRGRPESRAPGAGPGRASGSAASFPPGGSWTECLLSRELAQGWAAPLPPLLLHCPVWTRNQTGRSLKLLSSCNTYSSVSAFLAFTLGLQSTVGESCSTLH